MAKYLLTTWERNGFHDSDFYASYWNDETNSVEHAQTGSTAYYGGVDIHKEYLSLTPEVLAKAITWLGNYIFSGIKAAEHRDVMEPSHEYAGRRDARLRLLEDGEFKDKRTGLTVKFKAGEAGLVIWSGQFGTFHRNGFNKRGRHNTRVGIKLGDGRVVFVALTKCRRDQEPLSDAELRQRADDLAPGCQFSKCFGAAWDTDNYALGLAQRQKPQAPALA